MFTGSRSTIGMPQVVHPYGYHIPAFPGLGSDVDGEARITAYVASGTDTVDKDFRLLEYPVELQEDFLFQLLRGQIHLSAIPAIAYVKVLTHKIRYAEGMGQSDTLPSGIIVCSPFRTGIIPPRIFPRRIEVQHFPWGIPGIQSRNHRPQTHDIKPFQPYFHDIPRC